MAIERMTKVFIVGPEGVQEAAMRLLQEAGVLHVEASSEAQAELERQSGALHAQANRLKLLAGSLKRYRDRETGVELTVPDEEVAPYVEERLEAMQLMEARVQALERLRDDLLPWGDFDPAQVRSLEQSGVHVDRFCMDEKAWREFEPPEGVYLEVVSAGRQICFYTLSVGAGADLHPAQALTWPELGLKEAEAEIEETSARMEACADELAAAAGRADAILDQAAARQDEASRAGHLAAIHREPLLFGLQGWTPESREEGLRERLAGSGLPLQVVTRPPLDEEEPPVSLKNSRFIEQIKPLLMLYGSPKYRELDPSAFFAPFMVLFFGICLGDAGYGILFYLIAEIMGRKWGGRNEQMTLVVRLCKSFAAAAVAVGVLTGSLFGIAFNERGWILLDYDVHAGDPMLLLYIALGLGLVHLSISYLMGLCLADRLHERMSILGTMFVLWGGSALVARGIWFHETALYTPLGYAGAGLLAAGVLLTLLFASDGRKWLPRLGLGLWNVYGLAGILGDLLSYARLFGLGLATSAIAGVMNELAGMVLRGAGPVAGGALAGIILLVGHGFNFALALLGSTIHSARLHFVEAFKSIFEGDGVEYRPFKMERSPK